MHDQSLCLPFRRKSVPDGDDKFSSRWRAIKKDFSKSVPTTEYRSTIRIKRHERGIWQRRFWEHTIRNEWDYNRHMDYIHFNPVKHGLIVPTLRVGMQSWTLCVQVQGIEEQLSIRDAERLWMRYHAERGNDMGCGVVLCGEFTFEGAL